MFHLLFISILVNKASVLILFEYSLYSINDLYDFYHGEMPQSYSYKIKSLHTTLDYDGLGVKIGRTLFPLLVSTCYFLIFSFFL